MALPRTTAALALVAVAIAAAGCGADPVEKANIGKVRAVVNQFSQASDASACNLLTGDALSNVYGGFNPDVARARANCVNKSAAFKGEPIDITKASVIDNQTAKVNALSKDGKFTYSITVRRPGKQWLIDQITLHKVRP
ncbi:MAG: hypothetical protein QOC95_2342 [Thermoleophilaceae bacterium]|jgi:hypothetical protein|nr:hypothetical protein [Thermoleophilaceae bacterium]